MSITIVTRYAGDTEAMMKVAGNNGPLLLKHGATAARVLRITTGPHVGQLLAVISYDSYASYEATQAKMMKDVSAKKANAMLQKVAVVQDRTILAEMPF
jgi:hypothetical protein